MTDLLRGNWRWIIIAAALALLGAQELRVQGAQLQAEQLRTALQAALGAVETAARAAEQEARAEETRRQTEVTRITDEAHKTIEIARADAAAADAAADRLRQQLAAIRERNAHTGGSDPAAASHCPATRSTVLVLAELFERADARAGELAATLDRSRAAGLACERAWDALTER